MTRFLLPAVLLLLTGCATVDEERRDLYDATAEASLLASEIQSWATDLQRQPQIPQSAVQTAYSFQDRAEAICDDLESVGDEARAGVDLTGLQQSLREIEDFEVERLEEASQEARATLLQQFSSMAINVRSAAQGVAADMG